MYQLNYHSESMPQLDFGDLENILKTANAVNFEKNISGCLIYHNSRFVQILEGQKKEVLDVYEKIKSDKRHFNVTVLWENQINTRYFPTWNMAFHEPKTTNIIEFVNNITLLSELSDKSTASLLSFWESVRKIISTDKINTFDSI